MHSEWERSPMEGRGERMSGAGACAQARADDGGVAMDSSWDPATESMGMSSGAGGDGGAAMEGSWDCATKSGARERMSEAEAGQNRAPLWTPTLYS
jgi:hypothetical protein